MEQTLSLSRNGRLVRDWFADQRKEEVMEPALDVLAVIPEQFWLTRNHWEAQHGVRRALWRLANVGSVLAVSHTRGLGSDVAH